VEGFAYLPGLESFLQETNELKWDGAAENRFIHCPLVRGTRNKSPCALVRGTRNKSLSVPWFVAHETNLYLHFNASFVAKIL